MVAILEKVSIRLPQPPPEKQPLPAPQRMVKARRGLTKEPSRKSRTAHPDTPPSSDQSDYRYQRMEHYKLSKPKTSVHHHQMRGSHGQDLDPLKESRQEILRGQRLPHSPLCHFLDRTNQPGAHSPLDPIFLMRPMGLPHLRMLVLGNLLKIQNV